MIGRPPTCSCGTIALWYGRPAGPETSQQLADPYTFTHLIHGALFYALAWLIGRLRGRPLPRGAGLLLATALACGWEIVENTPLVIERYRNATAALGYTGDSVLNSLGDIGAALLGYAAAARLPAVATVGAVVAVEVALALTIRDNLTLNVLMLLAPLESVRRWQSG